MNIKPVVICVGIILLYALPFNSQPKAAPIAPSTSPTARYQLFSADTESSWEGTVVRSTDMYLLDSQQGKVWRYAPASKTRDGKIRIERFDPVPITSEE